MVYLILIHRIVIYPVDSVNQPLNNWVQKLVGVSYKVWDPSTMFYEAPNLVLNVDFFFQLKVCNCWTFQWREQTVWPVGASFVPQWRLWSDSDLVKNWWLKYKGMKNSSLQHSHKIKSLVMSIGVDSSQIYHFLKLLYMYPLWVKQGSH